MITHLVHPPHSSSDEAEMMPAFDLAELDLRARLEQRTAWQKLSTLFDGEAMKAWLHQAYHLPEQYCIIACEPDTPIYLPEEEACILTYDLTLREETTGKMRSAFLNARAFASRLDYENHVAQLSDQAVALPPPFVQGRGELPSLFTTTAVFPLDDTLPTISRAMDEREITAVLRHALNNSTLNQTAITLIRYKHRRTCVIRYQPNGGPTLYGKISSHDSNASLVKAIRALQAHIATWCKPQQFAIPHAYGFYPAHQLTLFSAVPGDSKTIYRLIKDRFEQRINSKHKTITLEAALTRCAQAAAIIHQADIAVGPSCTSEQDLAQLADHTAVALDIAPAFGRQLQSWLSQLQAYASQTIPLPLCLSHMDFTYKQFLFAGEQSGLIDFDTLGQAEPARDLGYFLAYLRVAIFRLKNDEAHTDAAVLSDQLGQHFLQAYMDIAPMNGTHLYRRVLWYEASTLIFMLVHSWQKFKGHRLPYVLSALEITLRRMADEV